MVSTNTYNYFMSLAIKLGMNVLGQVAPNPAVGCVLECNGEVLSSGVTDMITGMHAEVVAINKAIKLGFDLSQVTMFVTLEPCCHYGKTPPCVKKIIDSGIRKVVIATKDYNVLVNGGGIKALLNHGVEVHYGVLENEARRMHAGFFATVIYNKPLVTLKLAMSINGKITAPLGYSNRISNNAAINDAHKLRSTHDAIMVGGGTLAVDNPELTCRISGYEHRSPIRVILGGDIRNGLRLLDTVDKVSVWFITSKYTECPSGVNSLLIPRGQDGLIPINKVLNLLCSMGITRLLVEGGLRVASSFLFSDSVDILHIYRSPKIISGTKSVFDDLFMQSGKIFFQFTLDYSYTIEDNIVEVYKKKSNEFL
ncbi:5-amino-6-(5-phosphoribosylamino)uracil reductase / Diaminohydroxyphosphoribosylaminopyrimidine deaminase [Candidatus Xenohaliotis californiensis]|uniref:Riboflavin biosynthesis protein RibD n=1 Tax=Candidatus Xenohaliotis californiensis TaxID=84677 RepID=A0ABM9N7H7_9RICK|nr:5-amino-6-(5-phosphoribosylamino)uracil reductase / Diaminohydroxyphosphoribosylaminopyrimidine deaminase [Candidatus Xenohaliotis californiensis]